MAKIPKLGDLSASSMFDKFKNMLDSLTGPEKSEAIEEALGNETDPIKRKLLEIEYLVNQVHDIQVMQTRSINTLRTQINELKHSLFEDENKKSADKNS